MCFKKTIPFIIFLLLTTSFSAFPIVGGKDISSYNDVSLSRSSVALQLKYKKEDGTVGFKKGTGILIGDNIILTAGHNVFYQEKPEDIEAIFSEKPCWGENICNEIRIVVKEKIIHPLFKNDYPKPPENDVAILKLKTNAPAFFRPVKLASTRLYPISFVLYGYGQSKDTYAPLPLSDYKLRELRYQTSSSQRIGTSPKFFLDQKTKGFCAGDSGAGLISHHNGHSEVIGIAIHHESKSHNCLSKGYFTDVMYFKDWINAQLLR
jgi:hypothetical protein